MKDNPLSSYVFLFLFFVLRANRAGWVVGRQRINASVPRARSSGLSQKLDEFAAGPDTRARLTLDRDFSLAESLCCLVDNVSYQQASILSCLRESQGPSNAEAVDHPVPVNGSWEGETQRKRSWRGIYI